MITATVTKVAATPTANSGSSAQLGNRPQSTNERLSPKWNNQQVVRSDQRNSGYTYNDWRNW